MKRKLTMGILMATLTMGLLTGCGNKEQKLEDVAPPVDATVETVEESLEVETDNAADVGVENEVVAEGAEETEKTAEDGEEMVTEAIETGHVEGEMVEQTEDANVEEACTELDVNEVTLTFNASGETISMEGGNTVVFTLFDDEMNMSKANISVFDAADYEDQIQMVKEKNHENVDAYGHTYWTATHTEENAVFAAYENEKFIVISWEGDESILDKIEYHLNWPY